MITNSLPRAGRWACIASAVALTGALASLAACSSGYSGDNPQAGTAQNVTLTPEQRTRIHVLTVEPSTYHTSITTSGVVQFDQNRSTPVLAPFSGPVTRVL